MGMFVNYDNLDPTHIPDNSTPSTIEQHLIINKILPRPLCDVYGTFIGYNWNHGEYFDFNISVDTKISINSDSIVYNTGGEKPDTFTVGKYEGQKAYNTVDAKSWTFVGQSDNFYMWVEDKELIYPISGDETITIKNDMRDKHILVAISDFRGECIYSKQGETGEPNISIVVNEELSKQLLPGVYNCTVKIVSTDSCVLKDKFIISIN